MSLWDALGGKQSANTQQIDPRLGDGTYDQYQTQYQGLAQAQAGRAAALQHADGQTYAGSASTLRAGEGAANQDYSQANANVQQGLSGYQALYNSIGTGPSLAQAQLNQGLNSSMAQQQSQAASATGGGYNQASAQRAAMMNGANMAMQTNAEAGTLRAEQTLNNQQAQASALSGYSGLASNQAQNAYGQQQLAENQAQYDRSSTDAEAQNAQANQYAGLANAYTAATGKLSAEQGIISQNNNAAIGQQNVNSTNSGTAINAGVQGLEAIAKAAASV